MIDITSDDELQPCYDAGVDPVTKRRQIELDSEDECPDSNHYFSELPSTAFLLIILNLTAKFGLRFSQTSRYLLGRWHNIIYGLRHMPVPVPKCCLTMAGCSAHYLGPTPWGFHVMRVVKVPDVVFQIMHAVWDAVGQQQDLDSSEYFCGEKSVTNGMKNRGARARGYDIKHDDVYQSLNSDLGFLTALAWFLTSILTFANNKT